MNITLADVVLWLLIGTTIQLFASILGVAITVLVETIVYKILEHW